MRKKKLFDRGVHSPSALSSLYLFFFIIIQCLCYFCRHLQVMFEHVITAVDNGGRKLPSVTQLGYTKEQVDAIQRLKTAKDNYERLGLSANATK